MTTRNANPDLRVAGKVCRNTAVLELVQTSGMDGSVEDIVRRLATLKLQQADKTLRALGGWSPPPFEPKIVANALGLTCVEEPDPGASTDAMLQLRDRRPTVVIYRTRPEGRANFSICHEIAHTLFPGYHNTVQYRRLRTRSLLDPDDQLEYLCDIGAAELLLPMDYFRTDVEALGFGMRSVSSLCERYVASVEAVCTRMVQTDLRCCAMALLEHQLKPTETRRRLVEEVQLSLIDLGDRDYQSLKKMRVTYSRFSDSFRANGWYLPQHKSVAEDSCIYEAARTGDVTVAEEEIQIHNGVVRYAVEALPVPARDPESELSPVFAFFFPI